MLTIAPSAARAGVAIHATSVAELAPHVRTLRGSLTQQLQGLPDGYTLDVSLVQLGSTKIGSELEVRAEIRAALSDKHGRMRWTSTARAVARGPAKDRALLERDAITAAAEQVARHVRTRCRE